MLGHYSLRNIGIISFCLPLVLCLPLISYAGNQGNPSLTNVVAMMEQSLKLNNHQINSVTPVIVEWIKQVQEVKSGKFSDEEQNRKLSSIEEDTEDQLEHYLTKEQMDRWRSMVAADIRVQEKQVPKEEGNIDSSSASQDKAKDDDRLLPKDDGVLQSNSSKTNKSGIY